MRKILLIAILLVGPLASAGALDFQAPSVGGTRIVALARDDGRYANSPLKSWFDQLASGNGLCCSFADGFRVDDVDWDTQDGHYRVRLNGEWIVVPDNAVDPCRDPTYALASRGCAFRSKKRQVAIADQTASRRSPRE